MFRASNVVCFSSRFVSFLFDFQCSVNGEAEKMVATHIGIANKELFF